MSFDVLSMSEEQLQKLATGLETTLANDTQKALTAAKLAKAGRGKPKEGSTEPTQSELAIKFGISRSMVSDAKKFLDLLASDEVQYGHLYQKMTEGDLTITEACKIVGLKTTAVSSRTLQKMRERSEKELLELAGVIKGNTEYDEIQAEISRAQKILKETDYDCTPLVLTEPVYNKSVYSFTPHKFLRELIRVTEPGGNICIICKNEMVQNYLNYEHLSLIYQKMIIIGKGDKIAIWFKKKGGESQADCFKDVYTMLESELLSNLIYHLSLNGDTILDPFRSAEIKMTAESAGRRVYGSKYY